MSTLTACVFLLSDFKRTVVKDYGVFNEEPRALEIARDRQEGIIRHIDEGNVAIDPNSAVEACNLLTHRTTP